MFHANFHGDFCNFSKITSPCFDLSILPGPLLVVSGWSTLSCLCSRGPLDGPSLRPAVVRLLKQGWRLYQLTPLSCPIPPPPPPPPLQSANPLSLNLASFLPTHHQLTLSANSHRSVRWWLHWLAELPANSFWFSYSPSSRPRIPLRNLHQEKNVYPPTAPIVDSFTYCNPSAFTLSVSSWFCASACHIKGEPGVMEPQAWNINVANSMAVWEINPLKIAPYTSWTHHRSLIHTVTYRNFCGPLQIVYCIVCVSQKKCCLLLCTISV